VIEDAILRGPLAESYNEPGTMDAPTLVITVKSSQGTDYKSKPIWRSEEKEQAIELASRIADAMR